MNKTFIFTAATNGVRLVKEKVFMNDTIFLSFFVPFIPVNRYTIHILLYSLAFFGEGMRENHSKSAQNNAYFFLRVVWGRVS